MVDLIEGRTYQRTDLGQVLLCVYCTYALKSYGRWNFCERWWFIVILDKPGCNGQVGKSNDQRFCKKTQ